MPDYITRKLDDFIDITHAPLSFIEALAEEQPSVACPSCNGNGCRGCLGLGFYYVLAQT